VGGTRGGDESEAASERARAVSPTRLRLRSTRYLTAPRSGKCRLLSALSLARLLATLAPWTSTARTLFCSSFPPLFLHRATVVLRLAALPPSLPAPLLLAQPWTRTPRHPSSSSPTSSRSRVGLASAVPSLSTRLPSLVRPLEQALCTSSTSLGSAACRIARSSTVEVVVSPGSSRLLSLAFCFSLRLLLPSSEPRRPALHRARRRWLRGAGRRAQGGQDYLIDALTAVRSSCSLSVVHAHPQSVELTRAGRSDARRYRQVGSTPVPPSSPSTRPGLPPSPLSTST